MKDHNRISRAYGRKFGSPDILMIGDRSYFPATERSRAPGYKNPHETIRNLCKGVNESFSPTAKDIRKKSVFLYGFFKKHPISPKAATFERQMSWKGAA